MIRKIITIIFVILATSGLTFANPFLVSDPMQEAVGYHYEIKEGETLVINAANEPDGSIKFDLKDVASGYHTYQVRHVKTDELWGTSYSDYVPFEFQKPSGAQNPAGLSLVPK